MNVGYEKIARMYELYEQTMYRMAYGILGDEYTAEDAVHDAFLKLIANRNKLADANSPKTRAYALAAARSAAIDIYRKRRHESEAEALLEREREPVMSTGVYSTIPSVTLARLPEKYRAVIKCRFINGITVYETAAVMGISADCVKKRTERARRLLGELIGNERRVRNEQ